MAPKLENWSAASYYLLLPTSMAKASVSTTTMVALNKTWKDKKLKRSNRTVQDLPWKWLQDNDTSTQSHRQFSRRHARSAEQQTLSIHKGRQRPILGTQEIQSPTILKNIPDSINKRHSVISDRESFEKAKTVYQKALNKSGYNYNLSYHKSPNKKLQVEFNFNYYHDKCSCLIGWTCLVM